METEGGILASHGRMYLVLLGLVLQEEEEEEEEELSMGTSTTRSSASDPALFLPPEALSEKLTLAEVGLASYSPPEGVASPQTVRCLFIDYACIYWRLGG